MFTGWAQPNVEVDQRSLEITWLKPASHNIDYFNSIPTSKTFRLSELGRRPDSRRQQLDLDNLKRLESFIGEHPELTLVVEHDVLVGAKHRRLHRRINLIETTAKLVASYCTLESNSKCTNALGIHRNIFKIVFVLAVGLRRLMEKAISDLNRTRTVLWAGNSAVKGKRGKGRPKKSSSADSTLR